MNFSRRHFNQGLAASLAWPMGAFGAHAPAHRDNVVRVLLEAAETGFDPARVGDLYSARVLAHIFEALYAYDPLAFPVKPRPLTAAAMPQVSSDFREWTVRITPGIYFCNDAAFKGQKRELTAADYVYTYKRFYDPRLASPAYATLHEEGIVGLQALRDRAISARTAFDYDTPVAGLQALDRYTVRFRLEEPRPRFMFTLSDSATYGAVAREVIEHWGDEAAAHPVGTGPYRLADWRRSSRIVLTKNENFRDLRYQAQPNEDDAVAQAWLARFEGRRLPLNDGVEIAVIEESQPRWLAFLNGECDMARVPPEYTVHAAPGGRLAPNLAKRGVALRRYVNPDFTMSWFNMEDPVVGGYTPEKVALRRAIELGYDIDREIGYVRRGTAVRAQSPIVPGSFGYDPTYRSINSEYDPARANALLDIFGYLDRNGDGWREMPDGSPLELHMGTQVSAIERQLDETWLRSLQRLGLRIRFNAAQWPENHKAARAGRLQMWSLGSTASVPDAQQMFEYMFSGAIGSGNLARARLPGFDAMFKRTSSLPNGPERAALFQEMANLVAAYMPYRAHVHRVYVDVSHPWITGWRHPLFRNEVWQYVEVDGERRARMRRTA